MKGKEDEEEKKNIVMIVDKNTHYRLIACTPSPKNRNQQCFVFLHYINYVCLHKKQVIIIVN